MATLTELASSKVTVVIKPKESLAQSILKDFITITMLAFCVYISDKSTFWTFLTGAMFLVFLWIKADRFVNKQNHVFSSKEDAIEFIEKSPDLG